MSGEYSSEFREIGLDWQHFKSSGQSQKEWHGPCPFCGGEDRFVIFTDRVYPSWNWWCRSCCKDGWADQINPRLKAELTPEQRAQWAEAARQEHERVAEGRRAKLSQFTSAELWRELHERMGDANRAWWEAQGIPSFLQDFYKLGFSANRQFEHDGAMFVRDAYTIPKFYTSWAPRNIDFRIVDPPSGVGKYRPAAGLPSAYFLSRPDYANIEGEVIIVEGSKKAIVVCNYIDDKRQVIGVPSKNSWAGAEKECAMCDVVYIMLDPDAEDWALRLAKAIGKRARVVTPPDKPDDMILNGIGKDAFNRLLRYAKAV
jgi:hypothetical protein